MYWYVYVYIYIYTYIYIYIYMSVNAMPTCGGTSRRQRFLFLLDTTRQSPTRTLQVGCMQPPHGDCGRRQAAAPTHGHPRATRCGADAQGSYRVQARKGHKAADKQAKGTDFQASCRSFGRKAVQQCSGIRRSKPCVEGRRGRRDGPSKT